MLKLGREIDQQVAADDDVELGERGVHDDILRGEGDHLPDLLADPVTASVLYEEAVQSFGCNICGDSCG